MRMRFVAALIQARSLGMYILPVFGLKAHCGSAAAINDLPHIKMCSFVFVVPTTVNIFRILATVVSCLRSVLILKFP